MVPTAPQARVSPALRPSTPEQQAPVRTSPVQNQAFRAVAAPLARLWVPKARQPLVLVPVVTVVVALLRRPWGARWQVAGMVRWRRAYRRVACEGPRPCAAT